MTIDKCHCYIILKEDIFYLKYEANLEEKRG